MGHIPVAGIKIYWRCTVSMGKESLQTNWFVPGQGANINILGPNRPINQSHFPEDDRIERQDFLISIKGRIEQGIHVVTNSITDSIVQIVS